MKKMACEHEVVDVLRNGCRGEQERLQDELEITCEGIITASKEFTVKGGASHGSAVGGWAATPVKAD